MKREKVNTSTRIPSSSRRPPPSACFTHARDETSLLDKAKNIKEFLSHQKRQVKTAAAKVSWQDAWHKLAAQRQSAVADLRQYLTQLSASTQPLLAEFMQEMQVAMESSALDCQQELSEAMEFSRSLRSLVGKLHGSSNERKEEVRQELGHAVESRRQTVECLRLEALRLEAELRAHCLEEACSTSGQHQSGSAGAPPCEAREAATGPPGDRVAQGGPGPAQRRAQLAEIFGRHALAVSPDSQAHCEQAMYALDVHFSGQIQALELSMGSQQEDKHGGWTPEDHAVFLHWRNIGATHTLKGARTGMLDNLALVLPHKQKSEIQEHDAWYRERQLLLSHKKSLQEDWGRQAEALLAHVDAELDKEEALALEHAEANAKAVLQACHKARLATKLDSLHAARDAQQEEANKLKLQAAQAESERQQRLREREKEERRQKSEALRHYHEQQALGAAAASDTARQEAVEAALVARKVAALNVQRVGYRQEKLKDKEQRSKQYEQELQAQAALREEALARLRAQVHVSATRDPQRLLESTASIAAAPSYGDRQPVRLLFPVHGYSSDKLFQDQRFKITVALREAGLDSTAAGRAAIANARSARPPRPDHLSTVLQASPG